MCPSRAAAILLELIRDSGLPVFLGTLAHYPPYNLRAVNGPTTSRRFLQMTTSTTKVYSPKTTSLPKRATASLLITSRVKLTGKASLTNSRMDQPHRNLLDRVVPGLWDILLHSNILVIQATCPPSTRREIVLSCKAQWCKVPSISIC